MSESGLKLRAAMDTRDWEKLVEYALRSSGTMVDGKYIAGLNEAFDTLEPLSEETGYTLSELESDLESNEHFEIVGRTETDKYFEAKDSINRLNLNEVPHLKSGENDDGFEIEYANNIETHYELVNEEGAVKFR